MIANTATTGSVADIAGFRPGDHTSAPHDPSDKLGEGVGGIHDDREVDDGA